MKKSALLILMFIMSFNAVASQNRTMNRLEINTYQQHAIVTLTGLALVLTPISCCYAACKSDHCKWEKTNYHRMNKQRRAHIHIHKPKHSQKNVLGLLDNKNRNRKSK